MHMVKQTKLEWIHLVSLLVSSNFLSFLQTKLQLPKKKYVKEIILVSFRAFAKFPAFSYNYLTIWSYKHLQT